AFIESDPATPLARESATWIVLNTPDGPEVNRAAEFLAGHHATSPKLALLCQSLKNSHHNAAPNLLRAILAANTDPAVRAFAGFSLAMILKRHATEGNLDRAAIERAASEAEMLFERVSADNGAMQFESTTLAALVAPELSELRTLRVGKTAPGIEGADID